MNRNGRQNRAADNLAPIIVRMGNVAWEIDATQRTLDDKVVSLGATNQHRQSNSHHARPSGVHLRGARRDLQARHWSERIWSAFLTTALHGRPSHGAKRGDDETRGGTSHLRKHGMTDASRQGVRLWDSVQAGLIVGLGLGCLSLIVFHTILRTQRLAPPAVAATTSSKTSVVATSDSGQHMVPVNTAKAVSPSSSTEDGSTPSSPRAVISITMPAADFYLLRVGAFSSTSAAKSALTTYQAQGLRAVIWSGKPVGVVTSVSETESGLGAVLRQLTEKKVPYYVSHVTWNASPILVQSTTPDIATVVNRWLSLEMAALNSLIAALQDGAPVRDAQIAVHSARFAAPAATSLATANLSLLSNVKTETNIAYQAFLAGRYSISEQEVLRALKNMLILRSNP